MTRYDVIRRNNRHRKEELEQDIDNYGYKYNLFRIQAFKTVALTVAVVEVVYMPFAYVYELVKAEYIKNVQDYLIKREINDRKHH